MQKEIINAAKKYGLKAAEVGGAAILLGAAITPVQAQESKPKIGVFGDCETADTTIIVVGPIESDYTVQIHDYDEDREGVLDKTPKRPFRGALNDNKPRFRRSTFKTEHGQFNTNNGSITVQPGHVVRVDVFEGGQAVNSWTDEVTCSDS